MHLLKIMLGGSSQTPDLNGKTCLINYVNVIYVVKTFDEDAILVKNFYRLKTLKYDFFGLILCQNLIWLTAHELSQTK